MKTFTTAVAFLFALITLSDPAASQVRFSLGAKAWYATWNINIQTPPGTESSDYSAAFLVGPYVGIRSAKYAATLSYSKTTKTFDAALRNTGKYYVGFNMNRVLSREDINAIFSYYMMTEISLFVNIKYLKYRIRDAYTYINTSSQNFEQTVNALGAGGGVQISVPFPGGSPFYSFISTGAVFNSFEDKDSGEKGNELLYFVDSGLGYRFLPSTIGIALGFRVENGKDTKAIVGPTANLYVTF